MAREPPPASLISIVPLLSLFFQTVLILGFQVAAVLLLWKQPFYRPAHPKDQDDFVCDDNYTVFAISVFQFITLAVVFSKGAPYRKPLYTNCKFMCSFFYCFDLLSSLIRFVLTITHRYDSCHNLHHDHTFPMVERSF